MIAKLIPGLTCVRDEAAPTPFAPLDLSPGYRRTRLRMYARPGVLAVALVLAGCVTTPPASTSAAAPSDLSPVQAPTTVVDTAEQAALKARVILQDRLYRVAAPLLVNNTELCRGNARKLLGFTAKNKYSFTSEYVDAAEQSLGLGDRLHIMAVLAGSGAARAGLRPGDILLAVDEKPMPLGPNAERLAASILGPIVNTRSSVKLSMVRGGTPLTTTVPLTLACAFGIELGNADNVNAYADGHRIMVTRGMMNFVRNDTELAYVIAREMAHSALGHAGRMRMSATLGSIIDNLIRVHPDLTATGGMGGVKPFPQEVDAAADTLALYMLARAGVDIDGASRFWERLALQYPVTVLNGYTAIHPATTFRMSVMAKILPEVQAKKAANARLSP
ncbi:MAG: hypothetical protein NVSMB6_11780 [Burkholderiaceae bacterium]